MTDRRPAVQTTMQQVRQHLGRLYPQHELEQLTSRLLAVFGLEPDVPAPGPGPLPGPEETILITYGDTFAIDGGPHLAGLAAFWRAHVDDLFSTVHVLPFFPSSSDGGFSVIDYRTVDPALGDWPDLAAIGAAELMVDLICNHGSTHSEWFGDFVADRIPGRDYYVTAHADDDLSLVTRPRTHPLLLPVETAAGTKHVWATFSHDQVDFDFANPDVLIEFCAILAEYLERGATRVRLDAIAYLWKQAGTTCVHLPETHEVVKLMRTLVQAHNPHVLLITETNVPHAENVSYFGEGDEAHLVYNFTLAPLLAWSLITARADVLNRWLGALDAPPAGCSFLNFIASHDGIGLRPVEDLIADGEMSVLLDAAEQVGGTHSAYAAPDGPRPYELNVSLADLLAGADGATADRFVVAHAVMLAVQGIPAFYVHSMLATPGDTITAARTGHNRDINRPRLSLTNAAEQIGIGWRADVFEALSNLIRVRSETLAFSPAAPQTIHDLHPQVAAIERGADADRVLALHNLSSEPVSIRIPSGYGRTDLLTGETVLVDHTLEPWQACWLS